MEPFPDDIIIALMQFLPTDIKIKCMCVSKRWKTHLIPLSFPYLDIPSLRRIVSLDFMARASWPMAPRSSENSIDSTAQRLAQTLITHAKHIIIAEELTQLSLLPLIRSEALESIQIERKFGSASSEQTLPAILKFLDQPFPSIRSLAIEISTIEPSHAQLLSIIAARCHTLETFSLIASPYPNNMDHWLYTNLKSIIQANPRFTTLFLDAKGGMVWTQSSVKYPLGMTSMSTAKAWTEFPQRCLYILSLPVDRVLKPIRPLNFVTLNPSEYLSFWQTVSAEIMGEDIPSCRSFFHACHPHPTVVTIGSLFNSLSCYRAEASDKAVIHYYIFLLDTLDEVLGSTPVADAVSLPEEIVNDYPLLSFIVKLSRAVDRLLNLPSHDGFGFAPPSQSLDSHPTTLLLQLDDRLTDKFRQVTEMLPASFWVPVFLRNAFNVESLLSDAKLRDKHAIMIPELLKLDLGSSLPQLSIHAITAFLRHPETKNYDIDFEACIYMCTDSTPFFSALKAEALLLLLKILRDKKPEGIFAAEWISGLFDTILASPDLSEAYGSCYADADILHLAPPFGNVIKSHPEYISNLYLLLKAHSKRFRGSEILPDDIKQTLAHFLYLDVIPKCGYPIDVFNPAWEACPHPPRAFLTAVFSRSNSTFAEHRKMPLRDALQARGYTNENISAQKDS